MDCFLVWVLITDLPGMGGPTSSYATASISGPAFHSLNSVTSSGAMNSISFRLSHFGFWYAIRMYLVRIESCVQKISLEGCDVI